MNWLLIATTVFIVLAITCYAIVLGYTVNTLDTRWEIISPQVKKTSLFSFIGTVLLIIVLSLFYTEHSKYSKHIILLISSIALFTAYSSIILCTKADQEEKQAQ